MPDEKVDNRESVAHMLSEFLRELAVLILVFVPLDYLLKGDKPLESVWHETAGVLGFSLLFLGLGIMIERKVR